mmetsp:Transcript_5295/g.11483  ORF Transcript_5295/g.11483 Transcript_5295/m.11483 type:complete len:336 (+) Transcript_5295:176-1183(+)
MAAGHEIKPLSNSQKLFLQRLLVSHVLTDERAQRLYESIKAGFANVVPSQEVDDEEDEEGSSGRTNIDHGYMGNDFAHCLGIINASLVPAFNLEIATVSLPPPYNADNPDNDEQQQQTSPAGGSGGRGGRKSPGGRKRQALTKYHAIVNRSNDAIARNHAFPLNRGGPHEMAYFRLVIEKLVESGLGLLEEHSSNGVVGSVGCPGSLNRMELINLRMDMEGDHEGKLTIAQVESALDVLEEEGWLVRAAPPAEEDSDDDEDENDNDDNDDDDEEEDARPKRRKRASRKSSKGNRRKSLKGTFYGIGPRSFMELGEFLQKTGLPGDRMPQSILHRV